MQKNPLLIWAPVVIGLAGCLLPDAVYIIRGEKYATRLLDNYSGWSVAVFLLAFGLFTRIRLASLKEIPRLADGFIGIYIGGFALFRLWQTFTLFTSSDSTSLSVTSGAKAFPREGLFLLLLSGSWFLFRSFRKT